MTPKFILYRPLQIIFYVTQTPTGTKKKALPLNKDMGNGV
jgi:hypothetical protein